MNILAIGAHPDDVEIGCGGTLLRHLDNEDEVHCLILTNGEGGNAPPRVRRREAEATIDVAEYTSLRFGDLHALEMCYVRQAYVEVIERAVADVEPDIVYCHNREDLHQNHVAAAGCSLIAAKHVSEVLSFRLPSTTTGFKPTLYVDITEYIDAKLGVIREFKTQSNKDYMKEPWIKTVAAGHAIEARMSAKSYAEAFYVERIVR